MAKEYKKKKPYKVITYESGNTTEIIGNNHWIEVKYSVPDWNKESGEEETCFTYRGRVYFLSEFMKIDKDCNLKEFDGYFGDSFFSGVLIKLNESCDAVKAYLYLS